ncbi:putative secreted protein [Janibacter sp. HTCC2649]|nr:putative secreted protein [Janibacter sp. HTCC2649]
MWVSAVVHNNSTYVGQTVTVNFNVLDAAGKLLKSESQLESFSQPESDHIVGTQVTLAPGEKVAKVEATIDVQAEGTFSDKPFPKLPVSKVVITKSEYGGQQASFELSNPTAEALKDVRLAIACTDKAGTIVGGGSEFPELVPASGKIKIDASVITSGTPVDCAVYTGSLGDSDADETTASTAPAAPTGTAEASFKTWVDQFEKKDWEAQYATLVSAQRDVVSEKEYLACRASEEVPNLKWSKVLSVTDAGTITIPGTQAKLPATKVSAQVTTSGMNVPVDAHMLVEDGQWKWSMTQENIDGCGH